MRKHLYFGLFAALFGLGLLNTSVRAQNFPISGRVVSASINLAPNSDAVVYTTPATGHFILNQLCGGSFYTTVWRHFRRDWWIDLGNALPIFQFCWLCPTAARADSVY